MTRSVSPVCSMLAPGNEPGVSGGIIQYVQFFRNSTRTCETYFQIETMWPVQARSGSCGWRQVVTHAPELPRQLAGAEIDHRRPAVRAGPRGAAPFQPAHQLLHLGHAQRRVALDRRALADQRHQPRLMRVASTRSSRCASPSTISTSAACGFFAAQDRREAAHQVAGAAERLDLDPQMAQRLQLLGDHRGLLRGEVEHQRLEQRLDRQPVAPRAPPASVRRARARARRVGRSGTCRPALPRRCKSRRAGRRRGGGGEGGGMAGSWRLEAGSWKLVLRCSA